MIFLTGYSETEDFNGYSIAEVIIWSAIWAFHWLIEEREGQPTPETIVIRRLYIYIASLVGLIMLSLGVGRVLYFILLEGYNALAATPLLGDESGLWRPTLREMLSLAIIGGGVWALHWLYIARRDYDSAIRQVYLYIFAILGVRHDHPVRARNHHPRDTGLGARKRQRKTQLLNTSSSCRGRSPP